jgi:hypothetical protein
MEPAQHRGFGFAARILSLFIAALFLEGSAFPEERPTLDRYRTEAPDTLAATIPKALRDRVTADPERKLPDLVAFLVKGTDDPFLKVKRIHDWIALNIGYDTSVPYGGTPPQQHWATVLAERKGVCSGYSNLFEKMAELAGFECEAVGGYARGTDYDLFTEAETAKDNHAWNAVKIGEQWYFADCTWDAGTVEQSGYTPRYSTGFLFLEPEKMIFSHFPAKETFQLLPQPVSREAFLNLPPLRGNFFGYCLSLETNMERITAAGERFEFTVRAPDIVLVTVALYEHGGMELKNRTFVQKTGTGAKVSVLFPRQGEWVVKLFARRLDSAKSEYTWCADFGFLSSKGTDTRFPSCYAIFQERGCVLHAPLMSPLKMGSKVTLRVTAPGARNAAVELRGKLTLFDRTSEKDTFDKTITVPLARELIIVAQFEESGSFAGLVRFEVGQ